MLRMASHIPPDDAARLAAVRRYAVLDTPADGAFDRITALASRLFDVPIALVTIVDEDRIWFKSRVGLDTVQEIPRDPGLCASAIFSDDAYIIESARSDPRALANPLVAGEFGLQFYAAAPLRTHDGFRLGTLCLLDRKERQMTVQETQTLETLAAVVMDELELRLQAAGTVAAERALRRESARLALENAQLYQREHRVALTLQSAMLPRAFPKVDGLHFDAVYLPASAESEIGGDWYDAFLLDPNHLLLSIGDVTGHGLDAAALMGKLRQSLRAIALSEPSPWEILRLLDGILRSEDENSFVTAFVGVFDIQTKQLRFANAGHPPPLLRLADGEVQEVWKTGAPLGLRSNDDALDTTLDIPCASVLLLYTDGLTESTHDVVAGEARLKAALAEGKLIAGPRPALALREALLQGGSPDDVAMMTVSFD